MARRDLQALFFVAFGRDGVADGAKRAVGHVHRDLALAGLDTQRNPHQRRPCDGVADHFDRNVA